MKYAIRSACAQAFTGRAFLAAVGGTVLALLAGGFQSCYTALEGLSDGLLANGFHNALLEAALASDAMTLALPILSALPFTASCLDDLKSGFIKSYLPRIRVRDYILGKLTACLLSGGTALVLGILAFYGASALVFLPLEQALAEGVPAEGWLAPLAEWCVRFFCSGALWSLVGMAMAAATGSRYMAYAAPFILYYVLIILCQRYFTWLYVLDPREWICAERPWVGGLWGTLALLLELTGLCGAWFALTAKRRLAGI